MGCCSRAGGGERAAGCGPERERGIRFLAGRARRLRRRPLVAAAPGAWESHNRRMRRTPGAARRSSAPSTLGTGYRAPARARRRLLFPGVRLRATCQRRGDSSVNERGECRGAADRARRPRGFCCRASHAPSAAAPRGRRRRRRTRPARRRMNLHASGPSPAARRAPLSSDRRRDSRDTRASRWARRWAGCRVNSRWCSSCP